VNKPIHVVGLGPAGLGFAVVADRLGLFESFCRRGLSFYDCKPDIQSLTDSYFPWHIRSNSVGRQFLENIGETGIFRPAVESQVSRDIRRSSDAMIPLRLVGQLMSELLSCLLRAQASSGGPRIVLDHHVHAYEQEASGSWRPVSAGPTSPERFGSVVVATGSEERVVEMRSGGVVIPSGELLQRRASIEDIVVHGGAIRIIGSSHSAFSAAEFLLRTFGEFLYEGQIEICADQVRVYFRDANAARHAGYTLRQIDCDVDTGEVHRFNGIRGDAAQLYWRILGGQEKRVRLTGPCDLHAYSEVAAEQPGLTISAVGCKPRSLALFDAHGRALEPDVNHGYIRVDEFGRICCTDGQGLSGLYGIGIGFPHRTPLGVARVGINIFHGTDGEAVVQDIATTSKFTMSTSKQSQLGSIT